MTGTRRVLDQRQHSTEGRGRVVRSPIPHWSPGYVVRCSLLNISHTRNSSSQPCDRVLFASGLWHTQLIWRTYFDQQMDDIFVCSAVKEEMSYAFFPCSLGTSLGALICQWSQPWKRPTAETSLSWSSVSRSAEHHITAFLYIVVTHRRTTERISLWRKGPGKKKRIWLYWMAISSRKI